MMVKRSILLSERNWLRLHRLKLDNRSKFVSIDSCISFLFTVLRDYPLGVDSEIDFVRFGDDSGCIGGGAECVDGGNDIGIDKSDTGIDIVDSDKGGDGIVGSDKSDNVDLLTQTGLSYNGKD